MVWHYRRNIQDAPTNPGLLRRANISIYTVSLQKRLPFIFLNISVKNQPVFTVFCAHIWWTLLTVSAILLD